MMPVPVFAALFGRSHMDGLSHLRMRPGAGRIRRRRVHGKRDQGEYERNERCAYQFFHK
jgi:hypothetical protein